MARRLPFAAVFAAAAIQFCLGWTSAARDACTYDETVFLTSGYAQWRTGQTHLGPELGAFPKLATSLPLLALRPEFPSTDSPDFQSGAYWRFGRRFLHGERSDTADGPPARNDIDEILRWGRLPNLLLLGGLTIAIYYAALEWLGARSAAAALLLAATCPSLLAHGRYATADLPVTLGFFLFLWSWTRLLAKRTAANLALAAAAAAQLAISKFSAPLVLPAAAVAVALAWRCALSRGRRIGRRAALDGAILLAVVAGAIWATAGFRYAASTASGGRPRASFLTPDGRAVASADEAWEAVLAPGDPMARVVGAARAARLLPESFLYGALFTARAGVGGRGAFLDGRLSGTGFRSFFPLAFLYKTPVGTMALLALGAFVIVRSRRLRSHAGLVTMVVFAATYFSSAVASNLNIGHRHLLPIYPVVLLVGACAFADEAPKRRAFRAAALAALVSAAASGVSAWPDYLAYFNAPSGGPRGGYRHLVESSLDWGHDLKRLGAHFAAHPPDPPAAVTLDYEGSASPRAYGIEASDLMEEFADGRWPAPGVFAVCATRLQATYAPAIAGVPRVARWTPEHERTRRDVLGALAAIDSLAAGLLTRDDLSRRDPEWAAVVAEGGAIDSTYAARLEFARRSLGYLRFLDALRERRPEARVGASFFVYDLDAAEIARILAPETPR